MLPLADRSLAPVRLSLIGFKYSFTGRYSAVGLDSKFCLSLVSEDFSTPRLISQAFWRAFLKFLSPIITMLKLSRDW